MSTDFPFSHSGPAQVEERGPEHVEEIQQLTETDSIEERTIKSSEENVTQGAIGNLSKDHVCGGLDVAAETTSEILELDLPVELGKEREMVEECSKQEESRQKVC